MESELGVSDRDSRDSLGVVKFSFVRFIMLLEVVWLFDTSKCGVVVFVAMSCSGSVVSVLEGSARMIMGLMLMVDMH